MTAKRNIPFDDPGSAPTDEEWATAENAFERHREAAAASPAFDRTRAEIKNRQATLRELSAARARQDQ